MLIINPGSGAVDDATQEQAQANMQEFLAAIGLGEDVSAEMKWPSLGGDGQPDGRWAFIVSLGERSCEVEMPGVAGLSQAAKAARIHPRLYVDGSSWYWDFAIRQVVHALTGNPDDD